jgi:hypothetical protein
MASCVAKHWVLAAEVFEDLLNDGTYLTGILDVLANLGENHYRSVLIAPVRVLEELFDSLGDDGKYLFVTD